MWRPLKPGDMVRKGDHVRLKSGNYPVKSDGIPYEVIKTELHYFEIKPENTSNSFLNNFGNKIVRYTDIGYYLFIEVWLGPPIELKTAEAIIKN